MRKIHPDDPMETAPVEIHFRHPLVYVFEARLEKLLATREHDPNIAGQSMVSQRLVGTQAKVPRYGVAAVDMEWPSVSQPLPYGKYRMFSAFGGEVPLLNTRGNRPRPHIEPKLIQELTGIHAVSSSGIACSSRWRCSQEAFWWR